MPSRRRNAPTSTASSSPSLAGHTIDGRATPPASRSASPSAPTSSTRGTSTNANPSSRIASIARLARSNGSPRFTRASMAGIVATGPDPSRSGRRFSATAVPDGSGDLAEAAPALPTRSFNNAFIVTVPLHHSLSDHAQVGGSDRVRGIGMDVDPVNKQRLSDILRLPHDQDHTGWNQNLQSDNAILAEGVEKPENNLIT